MNPEILNIYIDKLATQATELMKTNILLSAQLTYQERLAASLNDRIGELEAALDKAAKKNDKTIKKADGEF
jgi:uncharacterized coiled-coil protein SlyX